MIIYCPTVSVTWRMFKALWEWLKYWLFVWDKFGFEKIHGNRNFGFDLLVLVRFQFLKTKTEPKFGFRTSPEIYSSEISLHWQRTAESAVRFLSECQRFEQQRPATDDICPWCSTNVLAATYAADPGKISHKCNYQLRFYSITYRREMKAGIHYFWFICQITIIMTIVIIIIIIIS